MKKEQVQPRLLCEIDNYYYQDSIKGKKEDYHVVRFYGCPNEKVYAIFAQQVLENSNPKMEYLLVFCNDLSCDFDRGMLFFKVGGKERPILNVKSDLQLYIRNVLPCISITNTFREAEIALDNLCQSTKES